MKPKNLIVFPSLSVVLYFINCCSRILKHHQEKETIMEQIRTSPSPVTLEKKRSLSPPNLSEVRTIGISEYKEAAQCLADAFALDEVARYFIDTDDMATYSEEFKWTLHYDILCYVVAAHCYNGIVTTIGPNYDAVALW